MIPNRRRLVPLSDAASIEDMEASLRQSEHKQIQDINETYTQASQEIDAQRKTVERDQIRYNDMSDVEKVSVTKAAISVYDSELELLSNTLRSLAGLELMTYGAITWRGNLEKPMVERYNVVWRLVNHSVSFVNEMIASFDPNRTQRAMTDEEAARKALWEAVLTDR